MKPRIAIPAPTSGDMAYNALNWAAYADAVAASGGEAVRFPLDGRLRDAEQVAAGCQGILLPGSPADVATARYGQDKHAASAPPDYARENLDEFLLEHVERYGKPLLAICFGAQMLNVRRGGTLIQDLAVMPVNHSAGRSVGVAHTVAIAGGSFLDSLVDAPESRREAGTLRLAVNSSHHQAVGVLGQGLRVSARCPQDGVVEAIEDEGGGRFVLGVQWHPERTFGSSSTSRRIFGRFVEEAGAWLRVDPGAEL